jgi:hypothetical protein
MFNEVCIPIPGVGGRDNDNLDVKNVEACMRGVYGGPRLQGKSGLGGRTLAWTVGASADRYSRKLRWTPVGIDPAGRMIGIFLFLVCIEYRSIDYLQIW